mgnify:CR=1 FL=1
MGIILKEIEIDNFKSYSEMQSIQLSDLSVLLGANSSGKSTALQALLVLKQTMECNSPDEEVLLSGKYVALGDYADVISDPQKDGFSFEVKLEQTERTENTLDDDDFKIQWYFKKGADGISASLNQIDIKFENLDLSLRKANREIYNLYTNGIRSVYSVRVYNLLFEDYVIHYDLVLNSKISELMKILTRSLISQKVMHTTVNEHVGDEMIKDFYFKLLSGVQDDEIKKTSLTEEMHALAIRIEKLVEEFCNLEFPVYNTVDRIFSKDFRIRILEMVLVSQNSLDEIEHIITEYEQYVSDYRKERPDVSELKGVYNVGDDPFWLLDREDEKNSNLTQLRYALKFYGDFYEYIISKIFFVGPIREQPKGLYNIGFETIPKYVGTTGAYFASVLLHENKKEKEYILPRGVERCTLSDALAEWMMHLNIASAVNVDKKNSFGFSVSVENMEQVISDIMNVGIGTSQILPVLISVLLSEPNEILIFEQPELHLHPYSQSRLADIFVAFSKYKRKIIIETHSEYFLLRLRYHIVKGNFSKECAAINFFQNTNGTKVETVNISGLGNITYPEGFKDETQELLDSILEAALERKGLS